MVFHMIPTSPGGPFLQAWGLFVLIYHYENTHRSGIIATLDKWIKMQPLNIKDPQLQPSVQKTLSALLKQGTSTAGKHSFTAAQISTMGLTDVDFRELVTAGVAARTNVPGGHIVRPMTTVATEVQVYNNGNIDVTLALDLV